MVLCGLITLAEQRPLLSCVEMLLSEAGELAAHVQSLESQVVVHSADLSWPRGHLTSSEVSVTVA